MGDWTIPPEACLSAGTCSPRISELCSLCGVPSDPPDAWLQQGRVWPSEGPALIDPPTQLTPGSLWGARPCLSTPRTSTARQRPTLYIPTTAGERRIVHFHHLSMQRPAPDGHLRRPTAAAAQGGSHPGPNDCTGHCTGPFSYDHVHESFGTLQASSNLHCQHEGL